MRIYFKLLTVFTYYPCCSTVGTIDSPLLLLTSHAPGS